MLLEVGGLCFAHLKGYKPSPAKILKVGTKTVQVEWLESTETSSVEKKKILEVSEDNLKKFVTAKTMKDAVFSKGIEKLVTLMKKDSTMLTHLFHLGDCLNLPVSAGSESANLEGISLFSSSGEGGLSQNLSTEPHNQESSDNTFGDEEGGLHERNETLENLAPSINSENSSKKTKKVKDRKKQNATDTKRKLVRKTLQESEAECSKKFLEKIKEESGGFVCRDCDFSTAWRLSARTHVLACGSGKRKKRRRRNNVGCPHCDEKFASKKLFNKHFQTEHSQASYTCTTCGKNFKCKQYLLNHLKIHDSAYSPSYKCDMCPYRTKDQWHMNRHKRRKHPRNWGSVSPSGVEVDKVSSEGDIERVAESLKEGDSSSAGEETNQDNSNAVSYDLGPADCVESFSYDDVENLLEPVFVESPVGIAGEDQLKNYFEEHSHFIDNFTEYLFSEEDNVVDTVVDVGNVVSDVLDEIIYDIVDSQQKITHLYIRSMLCSEIYNVVEFSEARLFICPFCGQKHRDKYNLRTHVANVHDVKVSCFLCGRLFNDKLLLKSHRKTCRLSCSEPDCDKSFKRKDKYYTHLQNHQKQLLRFS